jgi:hypothetical protein
MPADTMAKPTEPEDPPPFLRSWRNIYALVFWELCLTVVFLYALTRWAS